MAFSLSLSSADRALQPLSSSSSLSTKPSQLPFSAALRQPGSCGERRLMLTSRVASSKTEEKVEKAAAVVAEDDDASDDDREDKVKGSGKKGKKQKEEKKPRKIRFAKYQGLGNDFIMVDNRKQREPLLTPDEAISVCNRNFGVGGDGVIFLLPAEKGSGAEYGMRIYNSDGSEPEMCGNGIRCLARFLAELEEDDGEQRYAVSTLAGNMVLNLREDGQVQVDMGEPILSAAQIPTTLEATNAELGAVVKAPLEVAGDTWSVTCVSMGNPHCIVFSSAQNPDGLDVASLDLHAIGPKFENHPVFPARINTEFVQVLSPTELKMRVWERGAGPTLACGTGACALVVAAVLEGRAERKCLVHLPGGPLEIEWRAKDNRIYMTGPAEEVFSGKFFLPGTGKA